MPVSMVCMSRDRLWPCMLSTMVCVCVFLCLRWEFDFSFVLRLWIVAIIHCEFGLLMHPGFGLLLSCFGHARAKNNSELSCGLEPCSPFVRGCHRLSLPSSQSCEGIVLLRYVVVGLRTVRSGIRGWVCMRRMVLRPPA